MKCRKGLAAGQLVTWIIIIVGFMLITGMLFRFLSQVNDSEAEVLCKNSIALRAVTSFTDEGTYTDTDIKGIPVLCKTIDKKIQGSREEIMAEISYKMARCFWMFGEGQYDDPLQPSRTDFLPSILGTSDPEKTCFNCYTILIDQEEIEGGPILQQELMLYMAQTNHLQFKDTTYLDYFGKDGTTVVAVLTGTIEPQHGYAISILPAITREGEDNWLYAAAAGVAIGVGAVIVLACGVASAPAGGAAAPVCASGLAGAATSLGIRTAVIAGKTALVAGIAGGSSAGDAPTVTYEQLFKQRRFPSIYLSPISATREFCTTGDIAGE